MYFDPVNVCSFPSSTSGMSGLRYSQILKALNTNSSQVPKPRFQNSSTDRTISRDVTSSGLWRPSMAHNRELATTMELVRRTNAEIAFVAGVTDIGLDDDLLRLRSRQVVLEGYSHNKQPKQRPWCHPSWGSIYKRGRKSYT